MRTQLTTLLAVLAKPAVALGGALLIAAAAVAFAWQSGSIIPSGQYTAAVEAPLTAVGGVSSDLSFQVPGQVVAIPAAIGRTVSAGASLVVLDQSALLAARAGAAANLEAAQARLAALQAGTRSEQILIDQTAVTQAQESLRDTVRSAYLTADDAIHNKVDQFFINPRSASAEISFILPDQALQSTVQTERIALEAVLGGWGAQTTSPAYAASDPLQDAALAQADLVQVSTFLDNVAAALAKAPPSSAVPLATLQGYQTSINTARTSVAGAASAITSAETALKGAQGALLLAQAGPTAHDIAAAQAAVDAAQATVSGIDVSLRESTLSAPFAGTITALDASLGQTVAPGKVLVSIESTGGSKAKALVVPTSSIIETSGQAFVYVKSTGAPFLTPVTTGLVGTNGMTEITSGLTAGQEVLTFGTSNK